ncbi:MAG: carboxypeptidase M32 [Ktedonobacteraceae bacterium]
MATREQHATHTTHPTISFTRSDQRISELLQLWQGICDLQSLESLASWDQQTTMPAGAIEARMHQMATLQVIQHERVSAPRMGELVKELEDVVSQASFTDADRGLVRQARRLYDEQAKLPGKLVEELARVQANSSEHWVAARKQNDFARFAPWLQRIVELQREVADHVGFAETRYDALLDKGEPGLTAARLDELFAPVRAASTSLLHRIQASAHKPDTTCLHGTFPLERQRILSEKLAASIGYDFTHGLIATSAHPFTADHSAPADVRFTVRYNEGYILPLIMACLHESGHALYEQGSSWELLRTPLTGGAAHGVHESQSRLWENVLGRTEPFWQGKYAVLRDVFPEHFNALDITTFVRALNTVEPGPIRIEADEVCYNLHIVIRFELEKALVNGEISVESLPALWNAKYRDYLGIVPENDASGVLQDVHWSHGFGSFPNYTLGNIYSAQIRHKLYRDFPDFDQRLATGDTTFVLQWLREHMYAYGAIYTPQELLTRMTGEGANPQYFVDYLTEKFQRLYALTN